MSIPNCSYHKTPMKWIKYDNPNGGFWSCSNKDQDDAPRNSRGYCKAKPEEGGAPPTPQEQAKQDRQPDWVAGRWAVSVAFEYYKEKDQSGGTPWGNIEGMAVRLGGLAKSVAVQVAKAKPENPSDIIRNRVLDKLENAGVNTRDHDKFASWLSTTALHRNVVKGEILTDADWLKAEAVIDREIPPPSDEDAERIPF